MRAMRQNVARAGAAVLVAGLAGAAMGQAATPLGPDGRPMAGAAEAAPDDAAMLLGPTYKDERAGIRMSPPTGARMISRAGLELVSYVQDQKQWNGSVERVILKEPLNAAQYAKTLAADLSNNYRGVQILDSRDLTMAGKDASRVAASMEGTATKTGASIPFYRQWLLIHTGQQEFVAMTLFTPLRDKAQATRTFDAMVANFELLDPAKVEVLRKKAVDVGRTWLAQCTAEQLLAKMNNQPQLFRMKINNEDVGYIQFSEYADPPPAIKSAVVGLHGFFLAVDSRSFPRGDARVLAVFGHNMAYWSYSKDRSGVEQPFHSVWDNLTTTNAIDPSHPGQGMAFWLREAGVLDREGSRIPAEDLARLKKQREEMVRQGDPAAKLPPPVIEPRFTIHVTWQGDVTQIFNDDQSRGIEAVIPNEAPAPLPKVLEYTWPRLVDLTKPSEMSFVVYNSAARKLALRTLSVKGNERVTINGRPVDAIKCTDELDPGSTTLWVDSTGKILMMRTSDQTVLTPTTAEEMQGLWKNRMK